MSKSVILKFARLTKAMRFSGLADSCRHVILSVSGLSGLFQCRSDDVIVVLVGLSMGISFSV